MGAFLYSELQCPTTRKQLETEKIIRAQAETLEACPVDTLPGKELRYSFKDSK